MKKSFTLIELLVVIAIIGILAAMILASISNSRARARDARRKNDLAQLHRALSLYYQDNNEKYPTSLDKLVPNYIKKLPHDPKSDSPGWSDYVYQTLSSEEHYNLFAQLEKPKNTNYWWHISSATEGQGVEVAYTGGGGATATLSSPGANAVFSPNSAVPVSGTFAKAGLTAAYVILEPEKGEPIELMSRFEVDSATGGFNTEVYTIDIYGAAVPPDSYTFRVIGEYKAGEPSGDSLHTNIIVTEQ